MIDACDAEYNAIKNFFPKATILMCWFYVKKNIKEAIKRLRVPDELASMILNVDELHNTLNFYQFKSKLELQKYDCISYIWRFKF